MTLSKTSRALVGLTAMIAIAGGTVACSGEDALLIGGTLAVVAGAVAVSDRDHDRDRDRHRDRDHDRYRDRDRHGGGGWSGGGSGRGPGRFSSEFTPAAGSKLSLSMPATAVKQVAAKYNLPLQSAERLTTVLQNASAGKKDALASFGLSESEMKRMAVYNMPSDAALDQIGSSLAMSREMSRGLVSQLMTETRAQMADINSDAWVACQATGKWKTNANGGTCTSTSWTGCSPTTGASMCASVQ